MMKAFDKENFENVLRFYSLQDDNEYDRTPQEDYAFSHFDDVHIDYDDNYALWAKNKKHIFELFGNKTKIYKDLEPDTIDSGPMAESFKKDFLAKNGHKFNVLIKAFLEHLTGKEINENKLGSDVEILDVKLRKGTRITRCFAQLELNPKRLEAQQNLYSVFLQGLKITGRLVLSIDPLDFYTMSVSRAGWSSCHHPNGEYGTGGLAYMTDPASVIAYIETVNPIDVSIRDGKNNKITELEMPNKIWRQIVNINPSHDFAMQLRPYPSASTLYANLVAEMLRDLLSEEQGVEFRTDKQKLEDISEVFYLQDVYYYDKMLFYSDFANGNFRTLRVTMREDIESIRELVEHTKANEIPSTVVGGDVYCACGCGCRISQNYVFVEDENDDYYD